jgi:hypothetical protein
MRDMRRQIIKTEPSVFWQKGNFCGFDSKARKFRNLNVRFQTEFRSAMRGIN